MQPDDRAHTWSVLIEEFHGSGRYLRPAISKRVLADNYDHACRLARDICFAHRPMHPRSPQNRSVFQAGDDTWIVTMDGATATFHFRVMVVRSLGEAAQ